MGSCLPSAGCWLLSSCLCCCRGDACVQGAGADPGGRVARICLAQLPVLSVCPAALAVVGLYVCVCGHGSSVGSASAAVVPHEDLSRVVVGMQWIRKKCPYHKLWDKEWVAIQSLVPISCCILSFCRRTSAGPGEWSFDPECQTCFKL